MPRLRRYQLNDERVSDESVRRLARWLGLKNNIDSMKRHQLTRLVIWLITRHEKKQSGLIVGDGAVTGYWR
jgi:hypothetical protein